MTKSETNNSFRQRHYVSDALTSRTVEDLLLERSKQAALSLGVELLEQEVEALCGRSFARKHGELCYRGGSEKSSLVLDGAKYPFIRPRVHDSGEVPLAKLRDQDLLDRSMAERMILGATSCKYEGLISAYSKKLSVKKSSVSRAFVRASQKDFDDINHADLSNWPCPVRHWD